MYFTSLSMSGFGPHVKSVTYEFENGVTFITGKNGSGKSTIFDAIQWVLYGPSGSTRTLKNRTSIINSTRQSATVVLSFVHDDKGSVSVKRSLSTSGKHTLDVFLGENKEQMTGGIKDKQSFIESLFGNLRHDVFSSVYMLQSSPLGPPSSFIGANASQRRELLSKIVDPSDEYASLHKKAKTMLRDEKKKLTSAQSRVETLQEMHDSIVIPELPEKSSSELAQELSIAEKSSRKTPEELTRAKREYERLSVVLDSLHDESDELFDRYDSTKDALSHERKIRLQYSRELADAIDERDKHTACVEVFDFKIEQMRRVMDNEKMSHDETSRALSFVDAKQSLVELSDDNGVCSLCGHSIDSTHLSFDKEHDHLQKELDGIRTVINNYKSSLADMVERRSEHNSIIESGRVEEIESAMKKSEEKINQLRNVLSQTTSSINKSNERIDTTQHHVDELELSIGKMEENDDSDNNTIDIDALYRSKVDAQAQEEKVARAHLEKRESQEKIDDARDVIVQCEKEVIRLTQEKERTSPNGEISEDISCLMDDISSYSTELYNEMFGEGNITITDGNDDEEKTCIMLLNDRDVATYSHGEQLRIYGCIQAGFTKAVYDKTEVWVPMMWDEPSLATDDSAVHAIFSIPEKMTPEFEQSFVITRDTRIDYGDNHLIEL